MTLPRMLCSISLVFALAAPAYADSDGYYCIGRNYIAWQLGFAAPPVGPHRLTIVHFDATGFGTPRVVDLPQFQMQGMQCGDQVIRLASFNAMFTVTLDSAPRLAGPLPFPPEGRSAVFTETRNLGSMNRSRSTMQVERTLLGRTANGHTFELVVTPTAGTRPCTVNLKSELVHSNSAGNRVSSQKVFEGEGYRECGGTQAWPRR